MSQRATLSPAGASTRAALPPGLGGSVPLPRQLSSACTSTRVAGAPGISGLNDDGDVCVPQDLLRVGHDHGAGSPVDVAHVGPGEQGVAVDPLDHARRHLARLPGLDVRDERHALHRQRRLGHADDLEAGLAVGVRVDDMHRAVDDARELHGALEGAATRVAPVERDRDRAHRRGEAAAHDDAPLGDADQGGHGGTERFALGGHAAAPHQDGVDGLGELGERHVRVALDRLGLDVQARRQHALARPVEHRRPVGPTAAGLVHVGHDQRAAEPLTEQHRLLEGRIGPRAAVQSDQQAREHGYGNTANDSRSCNGNASSSPVIGSRAWRASSRSCVSSRSRTSAATSALSRSGATAITSPPDVCASASRRRVGASTLAANWTASATSATFRFVPPGIAPRSVAARAPGKSGTAAARSSAARPLAASRVCRWPSRPNPVTSVAACTPTASMARAAPALSVVIAATAGASSAALTRSRLSAVVSTPVPSGFVGTSASPGWAPAFVTMRSGCTSPIATMLYFGSGLSTEWPPNTNAPAACATSAPPRSTSPSSSNGSVSRGHPTTFNASSGVAPIAYTSENALAAAMRPKS